jgi:hypothetical protein
MTTIAHGESYAILRALPADAYLVWENFGTHYDTMNPERAAEQYAEGLRISREAAEVSISCRGTWGARLASGGDVTSYEGIGYHAHTDSLLRGFLEGPAPVVVYRLDGEFCTEIKPRTAA